MTRTGDDRGKSSSTSSSIRASSARIGISTCLWSTRRRVRKTSSFASPSTIVGPKRPGVIQATHPELGEYRLLCDGAPELLFTENESNASRLWGQPNPSPYVKDAFHNYVIAGDHDAVNPSKVGTKAAAFYRLEVPAGGSKVVRVRLSAKPAADAFATFDQIFAARMADADEFYERITPPSLSEDERRVHRQALAGMLGGKQYS